MRHSAYVVLLISLSCAQVENSVDPLRQIYITLYILYHRVSVCGAGFIKQFRGTSQLGSDVFYLLCVIGAILETHYFLIL